MWPQGADKNPQAEKSPGRAPGPGGTVLAGELAQAAVRLQQQFPGIKIEGKLSAEDDAFWASCVRRGGHYCPSSTSSPPYSGCLRESSARASR